MHRGKNPIFELRNNCFDTPQPNNEIQQHENENIWILLTALILLSCKPQYHIAEMSGSITEMNSSFDTPQHAAMHALVLSYKSELDEKMNEVIATSEQAMMYGRPESLLTNYTSDVMKAYGDEQLEKGADVSDDECTRAPSFDAQRRHHGRQPLRNLLIRQRHHLS